MCGAQFGAGFDAVACSDHYQPWWEPGESGMAWVWLGAAAQATRHVPVGTAGEIEDVGETRVCIRRHRVKLLRALGMLKRIFQSAHRYQEQCVP